MPDNTEQIQQLCEQINELSHTHDRAAFPNKVVVTKLAAVDGKSVNYYIALNTEASAANPAPQVAPDAKLSPGAAEKVTTATEQARAAQNEDSAS